jgi:hypothetical protein
LFCGFLGCPALFGSWLARVESSKAPTFKTWGTKLVSLHERVLFRPVLAMVRVSTATWELKAMANACEVFWWVTAALMLLFVYLAHLLPGQTVPP